MSRKILLYLFFGLQIASFVAQIEYGTEYFKFSMYHEITKYKFVCVVDEKQLSSKEFFKRYRFQDSGNWRAIEHLFFGIKTRETFYGNKMEKVSVQCSYSEDLDVKSWKWENIPTRTDKQFKNK